MKEKAAKLYFPEVDIVKGIAILLVILGHSFCSFPHNLNSHFSPLFQEIVVSFQMPLFFIASGFLFSTNNQFHSFLNKKIKRLVIPYIVFGLISVVLRFLFSSITRGGVINLLDSMYGIIEGHHYWFLYTLIWLMIIVQLIKKKYLLFVIATISIVCCLNTDILEIKHFTIGRTVYYSTFFILGFLSQEHLTKLNSISFSKNIVSVTIVSALYVVSFVFKDKSNIVSLYIVPIVGSALTWLIAISMSHYSSKLLIHFGHYSLQYYLNHLIIMLPIYYISYITFTPILQLLSIWVIAIFISWLMLQIEKKYALLGLLCGITSKKNTTTIRAK